MKFPSQRNRLLSSPSSKMAIKLSSLAILLLLCYSMVSTYFVVEKVSIPNGCAVSCPPQRDSSRFICAKHSVTGRPGMFDSECFFGRYNHCIYVDSRKFVDQSIGFQLKSLISAYEFVRYGNCQSRDF